MEALIQCLEAFWRFSVPPLSDRERYTFKNLPLALGTLLPIVLAAYIRLRHPQTPLFVKAVVLLAGLPIISHLLLKRYFVGVWYDSNGVPLSINHLNFLFGMASGVCILKFIEVLLLEDDSDFEVKDADEFRRNQGKEKERSNGYYTLERPATFPGCIFPLEIDIIAGIRGIGYNWGPKSSKSGYKAIIESQQLSKKPPSIALKEKWFHIRRVARTCVLSYITMDVCDSIIKEPSIFPPGGRLGGGRVMEAADGRLGIFGPPIVTFSMGFLVVVGLQFFNSLVYLVNLLLTRPVEIPITVARWDPLPFDQPHLATSLSSFWSKKWHSFVRRTFMVFAYKPMQRISTTLGLPSKAGQALSIIATFILSGLLHEGCLEGQVNQYYDVALHQQHGHTYLAYESRRVQSRYGFGARHFSTTYAFTVQAFFVLGESVWLSSIESHLARILFRTQEAKNVKLVNGRLRSFLGWLWTMSCMLYSGVILSDLWFAHGLVNSVCSFRLASTIAQLLSSAFSR